MSPKHKRQAGEAVALALYFIIDGYEIWPQSHLRGLIFAVFGVSVVLFMELPWWKWAIATAAMGVVALVWYIYVGPNQIPDTEVIGVLEPGNVPTPPNGCDHAPPGFQLGDDALKVLIGDNAIVQTGMGKFTALQIGSCPVLAMERTPAGVGVYADLYDDNGKLIARVENNALHVLTGERISISHAGDLSTLVVTKDGKTELLYMRYLNPTAVSARGVFGCPGHPPVTVTDEHPIPGISLNKSCFANSRIGIQIQ